MPRSEGVGEVTLHPDNREELDERSHLPPLVKIASLLASTSGETGGIDPSLRLGFLSISLFYTHDGVLGRVPVARDCFAIA